MTLNKLVTNGYRGNIIALVSGALLTLAFAPFNIYPLAIFAPAILLCTWLKASAEKAFLRGWLFGLGLFGSGIYWIGISLHKYEELSLVLSILITLGFVNILALTPAITGYLLNLSFPKNTYYKILLAFPAYWVLLEWLRGWLFTGFPWLSIGYSQLDTILAGYAPLFSVYGMTLMAILSSALLVNAAIHFRHYEKLLAFKNIAIIMMIWIIGAYFNLVMWTAPYQKPVQVSLVQGGISSGLPLQNELLANTLHRYDSLTLPHWQSDIIIWPENAIPVPLQYTGSYLGALDNVANKNNSAFITGILIKSTKKQGYYDAAIAIGAANGAYLKTRLAPFIEDIPFATQLNKLTKRPSSNYNLISGFKATDIQTTSQLTVKGLHILTVIGYEIIYPQQVRSQQANTNLLLDLSHSSWFGSFIAEAQYLQMAEMRAVEMRRPLLIVNNDSLTAIINPVGKIESSIPPFIPGVLTEKVQPREGQTPWQQTGLDPLLIILAGMLIYSFRKRKADAAP